jgi:hypothetical protein
VDAWSEQKNCAIRVGVNCCLQIIAGIYLYFCHNELLFRKSKPLFELIRIQFPTQSEGPATLTSPHIKPVDARCIALVGVVSFLVGVIMTFSIMTIAGASSADGNEEEVSMVRYQQNLFDCLDDVHRGGAGHGAVGQPHDARHKKICDEMRRIAEETVQAAVEKHHPKAVE